MSKVKDFVTEQDQIFIKKCLDIFEELVPGMSNTTKAIIVSRISFVRTEMENEFLDYIYEFIKSEMTKKGE